MRSITLHCLILVSGMLLVSRVDAQTTNSWDASPGTPADWNEDANWTSAFGPFVPKAEFDENALIGNGGTAVVSSTVPDVLDLSVNNGTLRIEQGGSLGVVGDLNVGANGLLHLLDNGKLSVEGNARNSVRITGPNVQYSVEGDYTTSRSLIANITGNDHSAIGVGGTANLGGRLQVELSGVTPEFGSSWPLLSADTVSGSFAVVEGTPLPPGLRFQVLENQGNVSLSVSNALVLTVDRSSGNGVIGNPAGGPVTINGYSIDSAAGLLTAERWNPFANSGVAGDGWTTANPQNTHLSELNLTGSSSLDVGGAFAVGAPYVPGPQTPAQEDVAFEYLTIEGELVRGLVAYTGPANDLVLTVNPETGAGAISNLSPFIVAPNVAGYSIDSPSGSLNPATWTSWQDSGAAGGGWEQANPKAQHLSELNLLGSTLFSANTLVELGQPFRPGGDQDLIFEYITTAGDLLFGTVEYGELPMVGDGLRGDFNADNVVDLSDIDLLASEVAASTNQTTFDLTGDNLVNRDDLNTFLGGNIISDGNKLNGDADFSGTVAFPDFLVLSSNFSQANKKWSEGDFDASGGVGFSDFLILSNNFNKSAAAAAAVPEPSGLTLLFLALCFYSRIPRGETQTRGAA